MKSNKETGTGATSNTQAFRALQHATQALRHTSFA
jgi:hypothetical protein